MPIPGIVWWDFDYYFTLVLAPTFHYFCGCKTLPFLSALLLFLCFPFPFPAAKWPLLTRMSLVALVTSPNCLRVDLQLKLILCIFSIKCL